MMTTYLDTPERPVTRAEIDRLTAIIRQLNDALDAAADREDRLRHECYMQWARADVADALLRRPRSPAATGLVANVALHEWLKDD